MSNEVLQFEPIGPQDASLLMALFKASGASAPWVEVGDFRHAQIDHRKNIDQLERLGYIRKERIGDKECYCLSLTAMGQLREHPLIAEALETADAMWREFQDHYKRSRDMPLALRAVADALGKPLALVDRVHVYMLEWWHTPRCITPAESLCRTVIVNEQVFDQQWFDDCINELRQVHLRRLQSAPYEFMSSALVIEDPAILPPTQVPAFSEPSWFGKLPPHAQALMREMHTARHSGLMALTAMGVRAVIDVVADDLLGAAGWGFSKKLTALSAAGHLTHVQHQAITAVVEVGHAAAHRAHVPSQRDVLLMLEALDHVLCSAYGLHNTPAELMARTPPSPNVARAGKVS